MYNYLFASLCLPLQGPSPEICKISERDSSSRPQSEPDCFVQPLITNYLNLVITFGMPFGECLLHMTFRMHTTQRETAPQRVASRRSLNLIS